MPLSSRGKTLVKREFNLPFYVLIIIIIDLWLFTKVQQFQLLFNINKYACNHKLGTDA